MDEQIEIERKYTLLSDAVIPPLTDWPGVDSAGQPRRMRLAAVYYDTPRLTLARNRITLRRRTGGHDAGWHLKLPAAGDARTEKHHQLTPAADGVPEPLRALVADLLGDEVLEQVCEVNTERTETDLVSAGAVAAIVCDDWVTTHNLIDASLDQSWHELEVELAGAPVAFLDRITSFLAGHGIPQAALASKLQAALGPLLERRG